MKQFEDTKDEIRYMIQIVCPRCKAELTLITNEGTLYSHTRKNDRIFGPCQECGAPFLHVVGI